MTEKHLNKKQNNKSSKKILLIVLFVVIVCVIVALAIFFKGGQQDAPIDEEQASEQVQVAGMQDVSINLGSGMYITAVGNYTGPYMEDGTDEIVTGVMMITVENQGEDAIQYAEIKVPVGDEEAFFTMSTLTPGSRMVLLEQSRMSYEGDQFVSAIAENVVLFEKPLSLCEDQLKIQIMDGAINVSNISGDDITEDIVIYYKNSAPDAFYGGITYRVRIEGGLKADEIRQLVASHFSDTGSTVMFVTIGGQ